MLKELNSKPPKNEEESQLLKAERDMLAAALSNLHDWITIVDRDYRIRYMNDSLIALSGHQIGEYCYEVFGTTKKTKICTKCPVREAFTRGKSHVMTKSVVIAGQKKFFEMKASPIKNSQGEIIGAVEITTDITEKKLAEEAVLESKEQLQEQLKFAHALNQMAENIINENDTQSILETMSYIIGEALEVDRAIIFEVKLKENLITQLCRWGVSQGETILDKFHEYGLENFAGSNHYFLQYRKWFQSHEDDPNPYLTNDNAAKILHKRGIKSLLWYPFSFHSKGYYLLAFNQLSYRRTWRNEEIEFIKAVAKQVEIATQKIRFINERRIAEKTIWDEKERALVTLHSIGEGVITTDAMANIMYLNPVAEELTGWTNQEAKGLPLRKIFNIVDKDNNPCPDSPLDICLKEGRIVGQVNNNYLIHKAGKGFAIEDSAAPIKDRDNNVVGAILVFRDVSEKRVLLDQMIYQAHHDPLTDLPNRILLNERLKLAIDDAEADEKVAVMFLDLDRFKVINDTLGHDSGDLLLKEVAKRIKQSVKINYTVSRLGGDEFTILLPKIKSEEEAKVIAENILNSLQEAIILKGQELFVTTSIGIAVYPNDGLVADNLLKHADTAMYRAKEQGGNKYEFFTPAMNQQMMYKLAMENNLRKALRTNQFLVYYQPQIDCQSREIIGVEALVRWFDPEIGLILPGSFIPLAEENGLIIPIGELVLQMACLQVNRWHQIGFPDLKLSVNLSASQFEQNNLVEVIREIVQETGFDPLLLEIEITESVAMKDVERTILILEELKMLGIRIAIDDFGTGYSSLNYLKKLPLNSLKIDSSFVRDIPEDSDDVAIVNTIIGLAKNLKLEVIAEGVETSLQAELLSQSGCNGMQGFYFSKPIPESEVLKYLTGLRENNIQSNVSRTIP